MSDSRPKVGIACFVWKDGKFLLQRRAGSHGKGTWSIPGGHLENGESFEACARRETLEEVGIAIDNVRLLAVTNDLFDTGKHYVTIWLEADWTAGEPNLKADEVSEVQWTDFAHLPDTLFEPCWRNLHQAKPDLFQ